MRFIEEKKLLYLFTISTLLLAIHTYTTHQKLIFFSLNKVKGMHTQEIRVHTRATRRDLTNQKDGIMHD